MKTRFALVVVAVLAAAPALAGWDRRTGELKARLEELARGPTVTPDEKTKLEAGIADWGQARAQLFESLVGIIADDSPSHTEQDAKWAARVRQGRDDLRRSIGDSLRSVSTPTVYALGFTNTAATEEDKLLEALERAGAGGARDKIIKNQQKVREMTSLLDEKWAGLLNLDGNFDAEAARTKQELVDLTRETVEEYARKKTTVVEKLGLWISKNKAPGTGEPLTEALKVSLKGLIEYLVRNHGRFKVLKDRLRAALDGERGGVYVLFRSVRKDTELFLRENEFPGAKKAFEAAKSGLDAAASAAPTSALRDDVGGVSGELLAKLSAHLSKTEDTQNAFIRAHEKKFFGPVGPDIQDALLETRQWEDWTRQLSAQDLDAQLRKWREAPGGFYEVSTGSLSSAERDLLKGVLAEDASSLMQELEQWERDWGEVEGVLSHRRDSARELE